MYMNGGENEGLCVFLEVNEKYILEYTSPRWFREDSQQFRPITYAAKSQKLDFLNATKILSSLSHFYN